MPPRRSNSLVGTTTTAMRIGPPLVFLLLAAAASAVGAFVVPRTASGTSSTPSTSTSTSTFHLAPSSRHITSRASFVLQMSLKPAAVPLMDSGKALARSGELLIDLTSDLEIYGGALSAVGALIRNSGDSIAQAAALCRFKTGAELACDELREGATCLTEACDKLQQAITEGETDDDADLVQKLKPMIQTMETAGVALEEVGKGIMMKSPLAEIGGRMAACGTQLEQLSAQILELSPEASNGQISSQRMGYAAEKMIEAGNELMGTPKTKAKGKGWLKG